MTNYALIQRLYGVWFNGVRALDSDSEVRVRHRLPSIAHAHNDSGQGVHTHVPLSSVIII